MNVETLLLLFLLHWRTKAGPDMLYAEEIQASEEGEGWDIGKVNW